MNLLSINLKNCYGITSLDHSFDFTKSRANLIYAPNGVMKTSLAKTFLKISEGKSPEEKIHNREPSYKITIDDEDIKPEEILVIQPFSQDFESKNISTLLVNPEKKTLYDNAYKEILEAKQRLINSLNKLSKVKKEDIEKTISADLQCSNIFEAIKVLSALNEGNVSYAKIPYSKIFDPKVIELLENNEVKAGIQNYVTRYNELVENSLIFKKGSFNPVNASTISSSLKKEKFFEASHRVLLNGGAEPIGDIKALQDLFEAENTAILGDENLKEISQKIISGVASVKTFQEVLEEFPEMAGELENPAQFRKKIWNSYYDSDSALFDELLKLFETRKDELKKIEEEALLEDTLWHEAQTIFKERFHVPFSLDVENHTNAILGSTAPNIVFTFTDENGKDVRFNRGQLNSLDFLSVGERRAMYLLYVIFEFKARLANGSRSIIIIDDIADSFDYKNKYAIIEYLKELAEESHFRLLVLTHNFDFYRTFQSRVLGSAQWANSFIAQKNEGKISLLKGGSKDVSNPFDLWKKSYSKNDAMLISMIPFVRNLIEYKDGTASEGYKKLTCLLHIKPETGTYTVADLAGVIVQVIQGTGLDEKANKDEPVISLIYRTADLLCDTANDDEICLEHKIALSIACRLKAEEFMWQHVKNKSPINDNQTGKLYDRLCAENLEPDDQFRTVRKTLGQVNLMTPENIHLNSFMYEPLMDMSCHHLIGLYKAITSLKWEKAN
mgnify:CR=1 FL=1